MNSSKEPTPTVAHHNIFGAIAFAVAVVSAAIHGLAFYMPHDLASYREGLPSYMFEGGPGFALAVPLLFVRLTATGMGIICAVFLITSCLTHRPLLSLLNIGAFVFLFPTVYATYRFLTVVFQ